MISVAVVAPGYLSSVVDETGIKPNQTMTNTDGSPVGRGINYQQYLVYFIIFFFVGICFITLIFELLSTIV
jgi:hypothetical protein